MEDLNQRFMAALKYGQELEREEREKVKDKKIASALRSIIRIEWRYDRRFKYNNNLFEHLEKNFSKWEKDPNSQSEELQGCFRIYDIIKFLEKCSK